MQNKNSFKQWGKRLTGVGCAAALVCAAPAMVYAQTYAEIEKEALEKMSETISGYLDEAEKQYEQAASGASAKMKLELGEGGRSLLASMVPLDLSWLQNLGLNMDVAVKDGTEAVKMDVELNETLLSTVEMYMDFQNLAEYIKIPQVSDSTVKIPLTTEGMALQQEEWQELMNVVSNPMDLYPNGEEAKELLDRYGSIFLSNITEGESYEETLTVEGVSEECTVYEGYLYEQAAYNLSEQILTEAKEDTVLHDLVKKWSDMIPAEEGEADLYTQFTEGIDLALENFEAEAEEEPEEDSGEFIVSRIWVDKEGNIEGRELSLSAEAGEEMGVSFKAPGADGKTALLCQIAGDGSVVEFSGSGAVENGILSGQYTLSADGDGIMTVQAENYDVEAAKDGNLVGTYTLALEPGAMDEESYAVFGGFQLVADISNDRSTGEGEIKLSVMAGDTNVGTLSITGGYGNEMEIPDFSALADVINAEDTAAMEAFAQNLQLDTVFENAAAAGVPEELLMQLQLMAESAVNGSAEGEVQ